MAEERDDSQKTEEPTPKRLEEARRKGDVPKSMEVAGLVVLAAGAGVIAMAGAGTAVGLTGELVPFLAAADAFALDAGGAMTLARKFALITAAALAVPLGALLAAAALGHLGQTGLLFAPSRLEPKLEKLSPLAGLKRLFGAQGLATFLKGVGKLLVVGAAAGATLWARREDVAGLVALEPEAILPHAQALTVKVMLAALLTYAAIAALDILGQRLSHRAKMRMSRQELRDEHKQSEGDPHVKARLKQIRQERARRRMMAAVPTATVVVTNPTHYAVALRYERGVTPAPVCVAKGVDAVALRIRELAEEHGVPIVEDPPLARALFTAAELDRAVPSEHFKAVAKVIGYVLSLAERRRGRAPAGSEGALG